MAKKKLPTDQVCPFCGSGSTSHIQLPCRSLFWVLCDRCRAQGPMKETLAAAIEAWNIKATSPFQKKE